MRRFTKILIIAVVGIGLTGILTVAKAAEVEWPRSVIWNPGPQRMVDTSKYKKDPPYTIAHCNAGMVSPWAVFTVKSMYYVAHQNKDLIKHAVVPPGKAIGAFRQTQDRLDLERRWRGASTGG